MTKEPSYLCRLPTKEKEAYFDYFKKMSKDINVSSSCRFRDLHGVCRKGLRVRV